MIDLQPAFEHHRRELTAHCYRMLGSPFDAEDAVQETFVRAWRYEDRFEGRSSLRAWLYRIATNVCLDMMQGRKRRAHPMDLTEPSPSDARLGPSLPRDSWVEPIPDEAVLPTAAGADPAELATHRDTIRLAFVTALQRLPPRQRAVLLLRDVLRYSTTEVATLLTMTVPAVTSALHRAHKTLGAADLAAPQSNARTARDQYDAVVDRYVDAFERYDVDALVSLLSEDATLAMPPYTLWLRGRTDIATWMRGGGMRCSGSLLVRSAANGSPALAQWRPTASGGFDPWAIHVLDISAGRISGIDCFRNPRLIQFFQTFQPAITPALADRA